jgi:hypothetical protein
MVTVEYRGSWLWDPDGGGETFVPIEDLAYVPEKTKFELGEGEHNILDKVAPNKTVRISHAQIPAGWGVVLVAFGLPEDEPKKVQVEGPHSGKVPRPAKLLVEGRDDTRHYTRVYVKKLPDTTSQIQRTAGKTLKPAIQYVEDNPLTVGGSVAAGALTLSALSKTAGNKMKVFPSRSQNEKSGLTMGLVLTALGAALLLPLGLWAGSGGSTTRSWSSSGGEDDSSDPDYDFPDPPDEDDDQYIDDPGDDGDDML